MTPTVVSSKTSDNIIDLMATMTERRIRHIPVIENGELKGIVSIGDVVKNRIAETEHGHRRRLDVDSDFEPERG